MAGIFGLFSPEMWQGASANAGQALNLFGAMYANNSGLTDKQLEAQKQADIRKKEQQKKYVIYGLIALTIIVLAIILIKTNKQ